jgi:hypothetical protein
MKKIPTQKSLKNKIKLAAQAILSSKGFCFLNQRLESCKN